jgi:hypothetical protein
VNIVVPHGLRPSSQSQLLGGELAIATVARHAFIQQALGDERGEQIVRAPDERHPDAVGILFCRL